MDFPTKINNRTGTIIRVLIVSDLFFAWTFFSRFCQNQYSRGPNFRVFTPYQQSLLIIYSKIKIFAGPNFRALVIYREKREN